MKPQIESDPLSDVEISRLQDLRIRLLHLHKSLLEMERRDFEKVSGQVAAGELLQLVINHAQFAWLRMISALVVEIDEILNGDERAIMSDLKDLFGQARLLFTSSGNGEFRTKYRAALQREPSAVMAHSAVMQLLRQDD
jgi:hypothetical protein